MTKYTDEQKEALKGCRSEADFRQLREKFPELSEKPLQTLQKRARELRQVEKEKKDPESRFREFLHRGRTMAEIREEFGYTEKEVEKRLGKEYPGYDLYKQKNDQMEPVFVYLPTPGKRWKPKKPIFNRHVAVDGKPFVAVQFPDNWSRDRLDLLPLYDIHWGSRACNEEKVREYVEYIRRTPNTFTFLGGDLIEYAGKGSPGSAIFEQDVQPRDQVTEIIELLRPIQHKILFSIPGNHEERSMRFDGVDIAQVISLALEVPYFRGPVRCNISWGPHLWRIHAWHGTSNSMTEGGKLNAAKRQVEHQGDFIHAYFMGHVHDSTVKERKKVCEDPTVPTLVERKYYLIILPAFMDYFGSYGEWKGWSPSATGSVGFRMYQNGDYHARS